MVNLGRSSGSTAWGLVKVESRNGSYGTCHPHSACHSALIPANLITFAHFSVSSAMSRPYSAGETGFGVDPNAAYFDIRSESLRAALTSALRFGIIKAEDSRCAVITAR